MEKFQGPTNPCFFGEHLNSSSNVESLEELDGSGLGSFSYGSCSFSNNDHYQSSFRFQEVEEDQLHHHHLQQQQQQQEQKHSHLLIPNIHDKMPFLQMLQSVESPPYSPFPDQTHFQLLLKLQQQQQQQQQQEQQSPWVVGRRSYKYLSTEMDSRIQALELESCITHEISEAHDSPIKSETYKDQTFPQSSSHLEVMSSFCNGEVPNSPETNNFNGTTSNWVDDEKPAKTQFPKPCQQQQAAAAAAAAVTTPREKRKRKRTRPSKNKDEVETQRMTHIAVERNRRKQMNDHLNALKSLMPTSFIQRGDQASIIGGAIDFVKELEQLLQSLEAKKKMRELYNEEEESEEEEESKKQQHEQQQKKKKMKKKKKSDDESLMAFSGFFLSPQYHSYSSSMFGVDRDDYHNHEGEKGEEDDKIKYKRDEEEEEEEEGKMKIMKKCVVADIEAIVIQTHVNLKILCPRRGAGQLLRTIAALEDLRLTILHLNVTTLQPSVLYSFNLKIEDDCKLGSADEIATAVHQIFSFINTTSTTSTSTINN